MPVVASVLEGTAPGANSIFGAFYLDTCQRVLWVCTEEDFELSGSCVDWSGHDILSGASAYSFLLRVATGLESQVVGETDVFGQLKEAWRKVSADLNDDVDFWIQKVFEDTKEIRSRHLQHLGGVSYGTLVRKFLKDRVHRGPTLLVGAGQLAQSVGPFLLDQEIWIINRSLKNAHSLAVELKSEYSARVRVLETPEEQAQAWTSAAQAIVCVPVVAAADQALVGLWKAGNELAGENRILLHLGAPKSQSGPWRALEGAYYLDDLFELQKAQGEVRSIQVAQAFRACEERAKLRALGTSVSIHHGWEDLAVFASV
jgi:glutamyl-tRNA reductase